MTRFFECLAVILRAEGGYVNDPQDHGGATNQGITQRTYTSWRLDHGLQDQDVSYIASNEVQAIYQELYWAPSGASLCPAPLDLVVFDCAVNSGVGRAVWTLQQAVGVDADGVLGRVSIAAIQSCDKKPTAQRFLDIRRQFYRNIVAHDPTQMKFLGGWMNRVTSLEKAVFDA